MAHFVQGIALAAIGVTDPAAIGKLATAASLANPLGSLVFWRISHLRTATLLAVVFALLGSAFMAMGRASTGPECAAAALVGLYGAGVLMPTLMTWTRRGLPLSVGARS